MYPVCSQIELQFGRVGFQAASTPGGEPGPHCWALTTAPPLLMWVHAH